MEFMGLGRHNGQLSYPGFVRNQDLGAAIVHNNTIKHLGGWEGYSVGTVQRSKASHMFACRSQVVYSPRRRIFLYKPALVMPRMRAACDLLPSASVKALATSVFSSIHSVSSFCEATDISG